MIVNFLFAMAFCLSFVFSNGLTHLDLRTSPKNNEQIVDGTVPKENSCLPPDQCSVGRGKLFFLSVLEGKWKTGLENSVVEFTENSGVVIGRIIASDDKNNVGVLVIKSVLASKNGKYDCEIYDPKLKRYFDAKLVFLDQNTLQVKASCCFGLFSETYIWKRIRTDE